MHVKPKYLYVKLFKNIFFQSPVCSLSSGGFQCRCEDQYRWSCDQSLTYGPCDNISNDTCGCINIIKPDGQYCQSVALYSKLVCNNCCILASVNMMKSFLQFRIDHNPVKICLMVTLCFYYLSLWQSVTQYCRVWHRKPLRFLTYVASVEPHFMKDK